MTFLLQKFHKGLGKLNIFHQIRPIYNIKLVSQHSSYVLLSRTTLSALAALFLKHKIPIVIFAVALHFREINMEHYKEVCNRPTVCHLRNLPRSAQLLV